MKIFPAIDIRGGNAVRLYQGDYNKEKIYSLNPAVSYTHLTLPTN